MLFRYILNISEYAIPGNVQLSCFTIIFEYQCYDHCQLNMLLNIR